MPFTDLPSEIIHMVLSQKCLGTEELQPFLRCKRTSTAAYHRLLSGRNISITCLDKHVDMADHFDFGFYGVSSTSDVGTLKCHLHHCLKPARLRLGALKRSSKITLNMRFDGTSVALLRNLTHLASHLAHSSPKELHLHVTLAYEGNESSKSIFSVLKCLAAIPHCSTHLKLCLQAHHLLFFAANMSELDLTSLNVKTHGEFAELKEPVSFDVSGISKLKVVSNYAIPNLSFTGCENSALETLEFHLPIAAHSQWIQENQLKNLQFLEDLRIFSVNDCHSLLVLLSGTYTLPHLLNLYISFTELIHDIDCFDFDTFAPSLDFLFIQDRRSTKTSNKVCKYTI